MGPVQDLHCSVGYTYLHIGLTFGVSIPLHSKNSCGPQRAFVSMGYIY